METFPQIDLFPRITKVAEGIKKILSLGRVTEPVSNHGAAHMLDEALDTQLTLDFDYDRRD